MTHEKAPATRQVVFGYRGGRITGYLGHPKVMPILEQELLVGLRLAADDALEGELCIEGDTVLKRLPYDIHGPMAPLFTLSESVETTPQVLAEAVLEVLNPASDSGNDWLEAKAGLVSEVRSAMDTLARRLAVLSGHRLAPT